MHVTSRREDRLSLIPECGMGAVPRYLFHGARIALLGLCVTVLLAGCSRKADEPPPRDFHVQVQDAQGLGVGSSVQWRGVEVGRVDSVVMDKGLVRIDVRLHEVYRDKLREGLRARPAKGFMGRGPTMLDLYGGDDSSRAILKPGAAISEATMADRITPGQMKAVGLLVVAVLLFIVVLRLMRTMVAFALALAFLVFAGWFMHQQWQKHGDAFEAARMEMRLSDMARSMLTEEAAQEAWVAVQTDLPEAIRSVGGMGKEQLDRARVKFRNELENKAKKLAEQGKEAASSELRKLMDAALSTPPETPEQ